MSSSYPINSDAGNLVLTRRREADQRSGVAGPTWPRIIVPQIRVGSLTIAGKTVRVRRTNFGRGKSFETVEFGPYGRPRDQAGISFLIRPSQVAVNDALARLEEHRAAWIGRFIAEHDDGPVCYWYNWICQVEEAPIGPLQGGGHRYRITERGCPAVDYPDIDAELEFGGTADSQLDSGLPWSAAQRMMLNGLTDTETAAAIAQHRAEQLTS